MKKCSRIFHSLISSIVGFSLISSPSSAMINGIRVNAPYQVMLWFQSCNNAKTDLYQVRLLVDAIGPKLRTTKIFTCLDTSRLNNFRPGINWYQIVERFPEYHVSDSELSNSHISTTVVANCLRESLNIFFNLANSALPANATGDQLKNIVTCLVDSLCTAVYLHDFFSKYPSSSIWDIYYESNNNGHRFVDNCRELSTEIIKCIIIELEAIGRAISTGSMVGVSTQYADANISPIILNGFQTIDQILGYSEYMSDVKRYSEHLNNMCSRLRREFQFNIMISNTH